MRRFLGRPYSVMHAMVHPPMATGNILMKKGRIWTVSGNKLESGEFRNLL